MNGLSHRLNGDELAESSKSASQGMPLPRCVCISVQINVCNLAQLHVLISLAALLQSSVCIECVIYHM